MWSHSKGWIQIKPPAQLQLPAVPGFHLDQLCGKGWKWFLAHGGVSQQSISWGKAFSWLFTELWYKMFCIPLSGVGTEELLLPKCTNSCKLFIQIAESC